MSSINIKNALSTQRLGTYESVLCHGVNLSTEQALKLYACNSMISFAFMSPLQIFEVVLRNAVSDALERKYGSSWPWNSSFEGSLPNPRNAYSPKRDLQNAKRDLAQGASGKVIAELKFVFWERLLTRRFDDRIWNSHLFDVFPNADSSLGVSNVRNDLRSMTESVRGLRNRIAHHEPIISRSLHDDLQTAFKIIEYRCNDTKDWALSFQHVKQLLEVKPFE